MIRVKEVIIVEGRYDVNTLSQIVDATIVETAGFGIFKDKDKRAMLRSLAERRGLIVFTDSDGAGFVIRNFLNGIADSKLIKHAYIPDVPGKEKRKTTASREGKLGVEGMSPDVIIGSLKRAGATIDEQAISSYYAGITKADLYKLGLVGQANSAKKRKLLQRELALPEHMSSNSLLKVLNIISSREELTRLISQCQ